MLEKTLLCLRPWRAAARENGIGPDNGHLSELGYSNFISSRQPIDWMHCIYCYLAVHVKKIVGSSYLLVVVRFIRQFSERGHSQSCFSEKELRLKCQ